MRSCSAWVPMSFTNAICRRKSKAATRRWFPPAASNLTRSRFGTLAFGAAFWTSSVDARCAALASLCQRSSATFASGCLPQKLTSTFRAMTRMPRASARFSKFVIQRGTLGYELRKPKGTSNSMILVPLFDLKFLRRTGGTWCRNFKSAALACSQNGNKDNWRWRASQYRKDSRFRRSERASRKTARFDAADDLDTEERQVACITAALETGDADVVRDALGLVALKHDPEKCAAVFGKDRAQTRS